jgi:hypothetical protein
MKKLLIILFAIAAYGQISAQKPAAVLSDKPGWHKIAETTVAFNRERDEVTIVGADRFASLKFKITDAAIDFGEAEIYFEKGDMQRVILKQSITGPGETGVIDLKSGAERSLKKIAFTYKTLPNRKDEKAHVEIWGLKTNAVK